MKYTFLLLFALIMNLLSAQSVDSVLIKQVDSLIQVSRGLTGQGNFEQALEVNVLAEKIALEKLGRASAAYGSCCFNRGRVSHIKRNYPEAEKWYLESKAIREKVPGKVHPDYAGSLNNLAILYTDMGNYEKAESFHLEAKAIREKVPGNEHPDYAWTLSNLGMLYWEMGNYEKAEPLCLEVKAIREKVLGKVHPDYAESLNNLGILYATMGNHEKAEPLYLEAIAIEEKVWGKEHPDYAASLNNLGGLYWTIGNYEKAEPLYLEAIAIREKVWGKEHPDYAASLNNLGALYMDMGNYEKAQSLYLEAKAIREKVLGKDHPEYAKSLNNLGGVYMDMGNYEKVEPLYLEAKAIREKVWGKEHPDYAGSLNNLGNLYKDMGNYEKAESFHLEAKAIREKVLGKEHPDYALSLNNLGVLYMDMGNYEKAEPLYLEAIAIREKVLGKDHPDYAFSLNNLRRLYEAENRYAESEPLQKEYFEHSQTRLIQSATFLSEQELSKYIATFQKVGDVQSSLILNRQKNQVSIVAISGLSYDNALFNKGFLLNASGQIKRLANTDPVSADKFNLLKSYRRRLAAEYSKPVIERKGLEELEEKANISEKEIARMASGYGEAIKQVNWQQVQIALKGTEAAIEFVSFKVNFPKKTDSIMYAALILKPGIKQPNFIPLFEEKSLDSLLQSKSDRKADYVNSLYTLADRGAVAIEAPKKSLYEILWKPLEKELTGIKTIYFSPSGLLHRINLDAIPVSETETLADKYQLIELNSTRQLVIPTETKNLDNEAVLYGGIQFEQDSTLQNSEPLIASRSRGELSFTYVDSTLRGGSWTYLAGTEREVNAIEKIMQTTGVQAILKKGFQATEESFKNIGANNAASPRILHIATHGYFFPDPKVQVKSSGLSGQNEPVFKISDHPMLRSGLIMAGGNPAWQGKQTLEGREDGILTAYEISQMNLSNTELVVLSACETGLGDIQGQRRCLWLTTRLQNRRSEISHHEFVAGAG